LTHALHPSIAAAPPHRQLLLATALAVAVHALLLLGLPHFGLEGRAGEQGSAFVTRLITPPAPQSAAPEPALAEAPSHPKTTPRQTKPPATRETPPPADSAAFSTKAQGNLGSQISLLTESQAASPGGSPGPVAIWQPLSAEATETALQFARSTSSARSIGDAPVRVAPSAQLTYRSAGNFGGEAFDIKTMLNWRQDGNLYDARWPLYTPRIGEHTRIVTGLLSPQGLMPVVAELRMPEVLDMRFDYTAQQVHFGALDADAPLRPGAQDRLSVLLQLGALLAGDAGRYPVGTRIELPAVHPSGPGTWRFTVEAEEQVTALDDRSLPTLRLTHQPEGDNSPRIEVWLGINLEYLPVRLRITEPNGDTVEHTIRTAYTQNIPPSKPWQQPQPQQQ
jgi:hypothetical protein